MLFTFPPNYAAIAKAFDVRGKPIIFAYGDTIHNPARIKIPPQIFAHEAVHQARQGNDPATWWARYIVEPEFRLGEEVPAHAAEYREICHRDHNERLLELIAARLASPLYGSMIEEAEARRLILHGDERTPR